MSVFNKNLFYYLNNNRITQTRFRLLDAFYWLHISREQSRVELAKYTTRLVLQKYM